MISSITGAQLHDVCIPSEIALYGVIAILVTSLFLLWQVKLTQTREIEDITDYLRSFLRKEFKRSPPKIVHQSNKLLFRVIELFKQQITENKQREQNRESIISQSAEFVATADKIETTSASINDLLLRELSPYAVASAILFRNPTNNNFEISDTKGISEKRIASFLLMLFDSNVASGDWGIRCDKQGGLFDLSKLEISAHLMIPIDNHGHLLGAIWLGLKSGFCDLPQTQQTQLKTIAKHAAASLAASSKVRELLDRSMQEKSFLLGVSHDLKAPGHCALYALKDLLSENIGKLSTEQRLHLDIIENSIREQLSIISDVLDMARFDRGFLTAQPERLNPTATLEDLIESHSLLAKTKGITIKLSSDNKATLQFDPQHFRRILNNLLSNAIKYSNQSDIIVTLYATSDTTYIEFRDSGIGIPNDQASKLFSEFGRMSNAIEQTGAGLGLAISQIMANLNNATLTYEPNHPQGSVFRLEINCTQSDICSTNTNLTCDAKTSNTFESGVTKSSTTTSIELCKQTILIIEDDITVARSYVRYLNPLGLTIRITNNLHEAIKDITEHSPNIIISDLHLGETDPIVLISELDRYATSSHKIFITGSSSENLMRSCSKLQLTKVLTKPVGRIELTQVVNVIMAKEEI